MTLTKPVAVAFQIIGGILLIAAVARLIGGFSFGAIVALAIGGTLMWYGRVKAAAVSALWSRRR